MPWSAFLKRDNLKPEDGNETWVFSLSVSPPPPPNPETGSSKIWIKCISLSSECIKMSYLLQSTNRVLADDDPNKFILINFERFRFQSQPLKETANYIERLLKHGVVINKRRFLFYGHSNSQLKSRSCYLYAGGNVEAMQKKIDSLGDFSKLNSVGKKAKRIGLLFSAAESQVTLKPEDTEDMDDIEQDGHLFTDGCGELSRGFASGLAKKLKIIYGNTRYTPSAFQVRYKGYKGMLMLRPDLKKAARFRHSMKKFQGCKSDVFGVLGHSTPFTYGYLNGELITLLSALGIQTETFLKKQSDYFLFMKGALVDSRAAFHFFHYCGKTDKAEDVLLHGLTDDMKKSVKKLINDEKNKMYKEVVGGDHSKEKIRIWIEKSRILYGVCDYTGILAEGECHVRITREADGPLSIDGAQVIVSRNPCLHPGDIRKFKAVECVELNHLVDCIVFPIRGKRDAASLMSGGDLDGDKFFVCWDPDVIPRKLQEPYGYPPAKEVVRRSITYENMIYFFAHYNNSSLGRVKNLYLEWAKLSPQGAACSQCQDLNRLFSSCVDGERIKIPEHLESPKADPKVNVPAFVLDVLTNAMKTHVEELFIEPRGGDIIYLSEEAFEEILSSESSLLTHMGEFELFQLILKWCRFHERKLGDYLSFLNFARLSQTEKYAILACLNEDDKRTYKACMFNGLYSSDILNNVQLSKLQETSTKILSQYQWKKYYSTENDNSLRLRDRFSKAMQTFEKKLLVICVDEQLTILIYIPRQFDPNISGTASRNTTDEDVGTWNQPIVFYAINSLNGQVYRTVANPNYKIKFDTELIQIYEGNTTNTFVWMSLFPPSEKEILSHQKKIGIKQSKGNLGPPRNFQVSIALQKFSNALKQSHANVTKQPASRLEIYVLSTRDRIGDANIYDIHENQVDTEDVVQNAENIPKEYEIGRGTLKDVDWKFRSFCKNIILKNDTQVLKTMDKLDADQFIQMYHIYVYITKLGTWTDLVDKAMAQGFWSENPDQLKKLIVLEPTLAPLMFDYIKRGKIYFKENNDPVSLQLNSVPTPLSLESFVHTLLKALLHCCNCAGMKESSCQIFKLIYDYALVKGIVFEIGDLVALSKRILFSVRDYEVCKKLIELVTTVEHIPSDKAYALEFIKSLELDYLNDIKDTCPVDHYLMPIGSEEVSTVDNNKNTMGDKHLYQLSQFIPNKYLDHNDNLEMQMESRGNMRDETAPVPDQTCIEIINPSEISPENVPLRTYVTILRTGNVTKIKNEDHVRFVATRRATDFPNKKVAVFDAIVLSVEGGKMAFFIVQDSPPVEIFKASWNVYTCGSTTNLIVQLAAIQSWLKKKTSASVGYNAIMDHPSYTPAKTLLNPEPTRSFVGLNNGQKQAVTEAINSTGITLVWGPPGTGKTSVIAEILLQFFSHYPTMLWNRILVTASSNNAVDNVMKRFLKAREEIMGDSKSEDVIRLASDLNKVSKDLTKWTLNAFVGKNLHTDNKARKEAEKKLKEAKIVFCTCSSAGVGLLRLSDKDEQQSAYAISPVACGNEDAKKKKKKQKNIGFDIVIVDEASQVTEPNCLIPIVRETTKGVILVGDHVQLRPTVTMQGKECGLDETLFERLYTSTSDRNDVKKVMLNQQYRMHPALRQFPSHAFYEGKLQDGVTEDDRVMPLSNFRWPLVDGKPYPVVFVHCPSMESKGGPSKSNPGQVKMVMQILELILSGGSQDKEKGKPVVVLTPYRKQEEEISKRLKGNKALDSKVEVCTIDRFQGREANIVVFSTVVANLHNRRGFLDDRNRINVAVTRAKYGMIIVGYKPIFEDGKNLEGMIGACKEVSVNVEKINCR